MITNMDEAGWLVYGSLVRFRERFGKNADDAPDSEVRAPEAARYVLERLGYPDKGMNNLIVTGSKGKGSVSRMVSSLLSYSGSKVGLYTSPHLVHINERIRVDGKSISDDDFIRLANKVRPHIEDCRERLPESRYIGPGAVLMAIAVLYFEEKGTHFNVFEVGVGGKYDEVNVLSNEWAVFTRVMEEHLGRLGDNIEDIVRNKSAIVKEETEKVFVSKQSLEVNVLFKEVLGNKKSTYFYGKNFKAVDVKVGEFKTDFSLYSEKRGYPGLSLSLVGGYQAENAATAVRVAEEMSGAPFKTSEVSEAFRGMSWPGRCEVVNWEPLVVVDGTIHRASAIHLKEWLSGWDYETVGTIVSIPKDKDYFGVIEEMAEISNRMVMTYPDIKRREYPEDAVDYAKNFLDDVWDSTSLDDALDRVSEIGPDLILVVGSQHIIGNVKAYLGHSLKDIGK